MEIIDCHTHIFPPEIIKNREKIIEKDPHFASIYKGSKEKLADVQNLLDYMNKNNITSAVALSFPFKDTGLLKSTNEYIMWISKEHKNIKPFIVVNPMKERIAVREMERGVCVGISGIGEIGFYEKGLGKKELKCLEAVACFSGQHSLPLMLHVNESVGHVYNGKIKVDFEGLYAFISRHPDTKFILAHLGGGLCFYEFMPEVKEAFKNVFYDTAASPFLYSNDIYKFLGKFLKEKVIFGTDYPLLTTKRYLKGMEILDLETQGMILSKNARRLFERA